MPPDLKFKGPISKEVGPFFRYKASGFMLFRSQGLVVSSGCRSNTEKSQSIFAQDFLLGF